MNPEDPRIQFVSIDTAADAELVAAVPNAKIRVLSYVVVGAAAETVQFESAATALTGAMSLAANGIVSYSGPTPAFETAAGEALNIELGATNAVDGHLAYILVPA